MGDAYEAMEATAPPAPVSRYAVERALDDLRAGRVYDAEAALERALGTAPADPEEDRE